MEPLDKDPLSAPVEIHGGDVFKDPDVVSAGLGIPPGRHVSAGVSRRSGSP